MKNSKLIALLEKLSVDESKKLKVFLQSPYYNRSKTFIKLYQQLLKQLHKPGDTIDPESLWTQVYGAKVPYKGANFRKLLSDFLKSCEQFLALQAYEKDDFRQSQYLMQEISKRKVEKLYNSSVKAARNAADRNGLRDATYYMNQYEIEDSFYELSDYEVKRGEVSNIEQIIDNLDRYYLASKMKHYVVVLTQQRYVSHDYNVQFIKEILDHIKKLGYEDAPAVALYYQMCLTAINFEEEKYYYDLKNTIENNIHFFEKSEANAIYTFAQNYCIAKANKGKQAFTRELFNLYVQLIDKEIIFTNNQLSPWKFQNVVTSGLRLGEFEWIENFIENYSHKITERYRDNAVTYNLARLYYYKKEYDKTIELLWNVEYEDISYNLGSKALLIATYYETSKIDLLESHMDTFKVFLNRHKDVPDNRRRNYLNLIRYTKKLIKVNPFDKAAIDKLEKDISAKTDIADSTWLLAKIQELEP